MLELNGEGLTMADVVSVAHDTQCKVGLAKNAREKMLKSRQFIEKKIAAGALIYGVNTGFGAFSKVKISQEQIVDLQKNLVRSHAAGVGEFFSAPETRAIMLLRANTLARGTSGIRPELVDKILELLNKNIVPAIPCQGSVGASGDLAPLSHLALALIGEGRAFFKGQLHETGQLFRNEGIDPLQLQAKEGLSLINGCQVMTAVGLLAAKDAQDLLKLADIAGALSLEALRGSRSAFDPEISMHRPHHGEKQTAGNLLRILQDSPIGQSHLNCDRVQDPYSVRCMPAVHGSAKSALKQTIQTLEIEANSSTDNPLVFAESEKILSCGNFHGQPVSLALDHLKMALTSQASVCERRVEKLINPALSELPAFLTAKGGLNSGFMMWHVTAAALVSECKILSHPASIDSIPTSADKEDHVSMGTIAARKLREVVNNLRKVVCIELMAAKQGIYLLAPLKPGPALAALVERMNAVMAPMDTDRALGAEVAELECLVAGGELLKLVESKVGALEC